MTKRSPAGLWQVPPRTLLALELARCGARGGCIYYRSILPEATRPLKRPVRLTVNKIRSQRVSVRWATPRMQVVRPTDPIGPLPEPDDILSSIVPIAHRRGLWGGLQCTAQSTICSLSRVQIALVAGTAASARP